MELLFFIILLYVLTWISCNFNFKFLFNKMNERIWWELLKFNYEDDMQTKLGKLKEKLILEAVKNLEYTCECDWHYLTIIFKNKDLWELKIHIYTWWSQPYYIFIFADNTVSHIYDSDYKKFSEEKKIIINKLHYDYNIYIKEIKSKEKEERQQAYNKREEEALEEYNKILKIKPLNKDLKDNIKKTEKNLEIWKEIVKKAKEIKELEKQIHYNI